MLKNHSNACRRVAVIKPHLHTVKLHSLILNKKVEIQTTPQMLRCVPGLGDALTKSLRNLCFAKCITASPKEFPE
eukprot:scaffold98651_cov39-Tisochrysis_lutea.AAC.1